MNQGPMNPGPTINQGPMNQGPVDAGPPNPAPPGWGPPNQGPPNQGPPGSGPKKRINIVAGGVGAVVSGLLLIMGVLLVQNSVAEAEERLTAPVKEKPKVAIADHAELEYCTPRFKEVLQRVLHSCGLAQGQDRRGCRPTDVKTFASISDEDFNALFTPLKDRGAVLMFDTASHELDDSAKKLLEDRWRARKGARYFFVVARASKTGTVDKNRALSHRRANSVMYHLKQISNDPKLDEKVGLLWLGNEFAQLSEEYCDWTNSRPEDKCAEEPINRSAFVSWVDCRL